jgi:hypothetical protein
MEVNDQNRERRRSRWRCLRPLVGGVLVVGLVGAVVLDARLVGPLRVGWFGALLALDLVVAAWLTRSTAV